MPSPLRSGGVGTGRIRTLARKLARERFDTDESLRRERGRMERLLNRALALASTDALTDLVNSRVFIDVLATQVELCREGEPSFGLMYVDLDNFKRVNDLYGHVEGDALLRRISRLIRQDIRREDVAARLGGDEFAVLVSGLPRGKVEEIAERVISSIRTLDADYPGAGMGASLGVLFVDCTRADVGDLEPAALLRRADAAMYLAKASGRKTVMVTLP